MKKILIVIYLLFSSVCAAVAADTASPPKRIVSLAPSTTEILFALGLGDNIVGVTSYCDYPEEAKRKPKIGGMSNPSLETIVALKPDIVVMTTDGNPKEFAERLHSMKIRTYVFAAKRLVEFPQAVRDMGASLGASERAQKLAMEMQDGIEMFTRNTKQLPAAHRKTLFIVWPEPLIVAGPGTVINDALALLGYDNLAASAKMNYPKYSLEEVIHQAPDKLLIGSAAGMDMRDVSKGFLKKLANVPAVKNNAVCYTGDKLYRLGPRVIKGIEELSACLR
jgi:iron complex transport system substrate-binding protein